MPGLIPLIKKIRPELPIVYRSHIEIRSDLVHVPGSPQEEVWKYLWNNIQHADLFISKFIKLLFLCLILRFGGKVTPLASLFPVMSRLRNCASLALPLTGENQPVILSFYVSFSK
jgi:hypothetical protein